MEGQEAEYACYSMAYLNAASRQEPPLPLWFAGRLRERERERQRREDGNNQTHTRPRACEAESERKDGNRERGETVRKGRGAVFRLLLLLPAPGSATRAAAKKQIVRAVGGQAERLQPGLCKKESQARGEIAQSKRGEGAGSRVRAALPLLRGGKKSENRA